MTSETLQPEPVPEDFSTVRIKLMVFLKKNIPLVVLKSTYFVVLRKAKMIIVKSNDLRVGDIRLILIDGDELVKGLSDTQWTEFVQKYNTLKSIVKFADPTDEIKLLG